MKKIIATLMAVLCFAGILTVSSSAEEPGVDVITVYFNAVSAGMTKESAPDLVVINPNQLVLRENGLVINDFAGNPYEGALKAGRTYYLRFYLDGAPGYPMPWAFIPDYNYQGGCDASLKMLYYGITMGTDGVPHAEFFLKTTVPGTFWETLTGRVQDWWIKVLATFSVPV